MVLHQSSLLVRNLVFVSLLHAFLYKVEHVAVFVGFWSFFDALYQLALGNHHKNA